MRLQEQGFSILYSNFHGSIFLIRLTDLLFSIFLLLTESHLAILTSCKCMQKPYNWERKALY